MFCSSPCRLKHWDTANRPAQHHVTPADLRRVPKHYHVGARGRVLVGHRDSVPWFGSACPPECPGLREGETMLPMEPYWRDRGRS